MHRLNITKKLPTKRKGLVAIANSGGGEGGVRISPKLWLISPLINSREKEKNAIKINNLRISKRALGN